MKRVGIFAGTFDPIHKGHVGFALAAAQQCQLSDIYFLPERQPRSKHGVADFATRAQIIRQSIQDNSKLHLLELADAQFSVKTTLPKLEARFTNTELFLLIGSDIACHSLPHWSQLEQLLAQMQLIIGVRTNNSRQEVEDMLCSLPSARYVVIDSPHAHVSSSQLRGSNPSQLTT